MQLIALALGVFVASGVGEVVIPWWNNAVYYRILVDSFKDGDGDGLGDIQGAAKQISYVRALGADAVILSPLSARSTDCSKAGTVDFTQIDPRYGDLDKFNNFLKKANKLELKVVITLHFEAISTASEWFNFSAERKIGYEDRVLWREGTPDEAPTIGHSLVNWTWHGDRNAYYGASNNEALLNLCSENTAEALSEAQCIWLRRGVAGVLLRVNFDLDRNCSTKLLRKLKADAMSCVRGVNLETPVIIVENAVSPTASGEYYGDEGIGANTVISNALTAATRPSAPDLALAIHAVMLYSPEDMAPTWLTSAENENRITTRYGGDMVDAINLLALILPGAAIIQQGDELGVADTLLEWATNTDCWPILGTPSAAPFPWDDTSGAGFTSGQPWLPLAPNYRYANAKTEFANDLSHVGVVRIAAAMRKSPAMGPHTEIKRLGDAIAVLRWGGTGSLLLVINLSQDQTEVELSRIPGLPSVMTVATSSGGSSVNSGLHVNIEKGLKLKSSEAVLLAGSHRHCGGPGPVDKIASKLSEGWQKINKYFST
ncbi:unnamed protein product [Parnassius mnemosyne]|uniref:alpha-glucosidase n=1 Tax=Parnassius mnemosyne TaxID=213953 RepID=A0AAV1M7G7_9NEOP